MVRVVVWEVVAMEFLCWQVFEGDRVNPEFISWPGSRPIDCKYIPKFRPAVCPL